MRLVVLLVVALAAAAALVQHRAHAAREARLSAIAGEIAGRPVRVTCQGLLGAALDIGWEAGSVEFDADGRPGDEARLKRPICRALDRFRAEPSLDFAVVQAVHTLAHEAWHLAGIRDEATAECYALQTTGGVAERLGAPAPLARELARTALERLYPSLPARYRTASCHDGGPLDLRPGSPAWP